MIKVVGGNPNGPVISWLGDKNINLAAVLVAASWRHIGYIMVLYLAGLKSVDPSLREAAAIDGASERQTFFRVVLPVLRPINVVILVITIIESLRAFDIVYVINKGAQRPRVAVGAGHPEHRRRVVPRRIRVRDRRRPAGDLVGPDHRLPDAHLRGAVMTAVAEELVVPREAATHRKRASGRAASLLHAFLIVISLLWLFPLLWTVYTSFRPYGETAKNGYFSIADEPDPRQLRQRLGPGRDPACSS